MTSPLILSSRMQRVKLGGGTRFTRRRFFSAPFRLTIRVVNREGVRDVTPSVALTNPLLSDLQQTAFRSCSDVKIAGESNIGADHALLNDGSAPETAHDFEDGADATCSVNSSPSRAFNEGCRGCGPWASVARNRALRAVMLNPSAKARFGPMNPQQSTSANRPTPFNFTNTTVAPCIRFRAYGRGVDRPRISIATPFL